MVINGHHCKLKHDDISDNAVLTEKELVALRGGCTTLYFKQKQTECKRELIGLIAPRRLDKLLSLLSPTLSLPMSNLASIKGGWGVEVVEPA